jgi:hypothetical protein
MDNVFVLVYGSTGETYFNIDGKEVCKDTFLTQRNFEEFVAAYSFFMAKSQIQGLADCTLNFEERGDEAPAESVTLKGPKYHQTLVNDRVEVEFYERLELNRLTYE